jgi:hypothetical protein
MAQAMAATLDQGNAPAAPGEHATRFSFDSVVERYDRLLSGQPMAGA